jgi:hypothetical protein
MSGNWYEGRRTSDGCEVWRVRGGVKTHLPHRLDLWNHSPTGLEWGYGGSGPAQLALALLADVLRDDLQAVEYHQAFKWQKVAPIGMDSWRMTADEILKWCEEHDQERQDVLHAQGDVPEPIDLADRLLNDQGGGD